VLKEDALAVFRVAVRFESRIHDKVIEISARNTAHVAEECERMLAESEKIRALRESRNVYCSRRVVSFDLMERPWRDVLMCLSDSKNDI